MKSITLLILDATLIFLLTMALVGYVESQWPYDPHSHEAGIERLEDYRMVDYWEINK